MGRTNVENDVVESQLNNIVANLLRDAPVAAELPDLLCGSTSDLVQGRRVRRVEVLQVSLLDVLHQLLLVGTCILSLSAAILALWCAVLALLLVALLLALRRVLAWLSLLTLVTIDRQHLSCADQNIVSNAM